SDLTTDGPGALLRVASGAPLSLTRNFKDTEKPPFTSGTLTINEGAKVTGDKAVLLDATATNTLAGSVSGGTGGTLDLGAPRISLGETPNGTSGLVLSGDQLTALGSAGNLVLRSYTSIDLYGTANIGGGSLANLILRSGGLAGYAVDNANGATISADTVRIDNAISGAFSGSPSGVGNLLVNARQITVGAGDNQKIQGF